MLMPQIKKKKNQNMGFLGGSAGKESTCNMGDLDWIPGLGRSPGDGKGYPLQYSGLENAMDCIVHGVAKSRTRLSDFHFHFSLHFQNLVINFGTIAMVKLQTTFDFSVSFFSLLSSLHSRIQYRKLHCM